MKIRFRVNWSMAYSSTPCSMFAVQPVHPCRVNENQHDETGIDPCWANQKPRSDPRRRSPISSGAAGMPNP